MCLGAEEGVDPDDEGRGGAEHLEQFAREDGDVGEAVRTHTHTHMLFQKHTHTETQTTTHANPDIHALKPRHTHTHNPRHKHTHTKSPTHANCDTQKKN